MVSLSAVYALYQVSVRQATISLSLLLAYISRCKPWESLWGSSATTPHMDFHHRLTACPSYHKNPLAVICGRVRISNSQRHAKMPTHVNVPCVKAHIKAPILSLRRHYPDQVKKGAATGQICTWHGRSSAYVMHYSTIKGYGNLFFAHVYFCIPDLGL